MEADAERGMPLGDARRFIGSGLIDNETRLREEASLAGALNRFIDLRAAAEIVGGEDELFQNAGRAGILRSPQMTTRLIPAFPIEP